jgi:peptide/nickel transport system substrate-binding protein
MRRRDILTMASGVLAMPAIARGERARILKFVPTPDLTILDPMVSGIRSTHTHAFLVFDTLYGTDEAFVTRPQMVEGHTKENAGLVWTLRLREGLRFHDGTPVLARDAVASVRRWAARDGFGRALIAATDDLSAPDDRTMRFRLKTPFPHLPAALSGSTRTVPCIMPERLAQTDAFKPVTEMIGSGPYQFLSAEFDAGVRAAYQRFDGYVPRAGEHPSHTAGAKIAHFDRVEWLSLGDPATAVAALLRGEVDWVEWPNTDQIPLLTNSSGVTIDVSEPTGSIAIMRLNHLHPPFDNPAIRRAVLGAIDQSEFMSSVAGTDRRFWQDRIGLFGPANPLANGAGIEVLSGKPDYDKVRSELASAGYRGEPISVLVIAGNSVIPLISQVGADQLRRAGLNVDQKSMDTGTMFRRIQSRESPDKGGWNVHFGIFDGAVNLNPATNDYLRGDGKNGAPGWPVSPVLEALRMAWLQAESLDAQKRIAEEIQMQVWRDVPYIPLGHWTHPTAYRSGLTDLPKGFPAFYGVRSI